MIPQLTQFGINSLLGGADPIITWIDRNGDIWPLSGGLAPIPPLEGVNMSSIEGLMASIKMLTQQGALQDGDTWMGAVYDPAEITVDLEVFANSPSSYRDITRRLISGLDPKYPGKLNWFTPEMGDWWLPARLGKQIDATWKTSPALVGHSTMAVPLHIDQAFFQSYDSVSAPVGQSGGFASMTNLGDQDEWARYLVYGPGTVTFHDPGGPVTFGPIESGQIVLVTTKPGVRGVLDLTPNRPTTAQMSYWQTWLESIIDLATNNNVPPLLQTFESWFGIVPPQGNLYSLLNGRFSTSVPATPTKPTTWSMPISVTGGTAQTQVIGALTPHRKWPE